MGLFDRIRLMEPIKCHSCGSTIEDKTDEAVKYYDTNFKIGEEETLKIMRLTDGLGGLKEFQTKDLGNFLDVFYFPGIVTSDEIEKKDSVIDLIEVCNKCDTAWMGTLKLRYNQDEDFFITGEMKIKPQDEENDKNVDFELIIESEDTPWHHLEVSSNRHITLIPKIEDSILLFSKKADEIANIAENYLMVMDMINCPDERINRIKEILNKSKEEIKSKSKNYKDIFANAVSRYDFEKTVKMYTHSALGASLFVVYHTDKNAAIEIANLAGINRTEFLEDVKHYEWFFNPEKKNCFEKFIGCAGGPNYYLLELSKKS